MFLNNLSAQYKQYLIYNLNSEKNVFFIHIVLQISSSVYGEEGVTITYINSLGTLHPDCQTRHIVLGIFCLFIHPQTPLHD